MKYRIELTNRAAKQIRKLTSDIQPRIAQAIESLADHPRPAAAKRLVGSTSYRLRIGDFRIIYDILDDRLIILIIEVGHRRDIHR